MTLNVNNNVDINNLNPMKEQTMTYIETKPEQTAKQEYIIDPEFQGMLPPKTPEQYEALKEAIRSDSKVRDPVVVWDEKNILLDGHHRHQVCEELGITPPIVRMSFANRDEAKMWVLENQLDRRNLKTFQQIEVALKLKGFYTAKAKVNQRAGVSLNSVKGIDTNKEVAKRADVSADTVRKAERILEKADEAEVAEAINALRRGAKSIDSVYQQYCVKKKMEPHQFCKIFPCATERELEGMATSIRRIGLREPIVLYEGRILDGKNRYVACDMAGVEPRYVEYDMEKYGDPLQFVISQNLCRSNLNESQCADVLEKSKDSNDQKQVIDSVVDDFPNNPPSKSDFPDTGEAEQLPESAGNNDTDFPLF